MGMRENASGEADTGSTGTDKDFTHSCSQCGAVYKSDQGFRNHLEKCNPQKLFHCDYCDKTSLSKQGIRCHTTRSHNKNERLETVKCENCGDEYKKEPHHIDNTSSNYCSHKCQGDALSQRVTLNCNWCGDEYTVPPSEKDRSNFCSFDCHDEWRSENRRGENHPQYKGYESRRGAVWKRKREEILERDNHRCQACGVSQTDLDESLHIHHIIPRVEFEDQREADKEANLVALCRDCHNKYEGLYIRPKLID